MIWVGYKSVICGGGVCDGPCFDRFRIVLYSTAHRPSVQCAAEFISRLNLAALMDITVLLSFFLWDEYTVRQQLMSYWKDYADLSPYLCPATARYKFEAARLCTIVSTQ